MQVYIFYFLFFSSKMKLVKGRWIQKTCLICGLEVTDSLFLETFFWGERGWFWSVSIYKYIRCLSLKRTGQAYPTSIHSSKELPGTCVLWEFVFDLIVVISHRINKYNPLTLFFFKYKLPNLPWKLTPKKIYYSIILYIWLHG